MQEQRTIKYNKYVVAEDFLLISNYNSVMEFPSFLRAVVNTSSKEYLTEKRQSLNGLAACFLLSGQKSIPTRAKKSIASFKLREGSVIGSRTTLRKNKLHTVIDKLLIFVLPRLYSEKRNNTILEMSSLLFLNKRSKSCNKAPLCSPLQRQQNHVTASSSACFAWQSKQNTQSKAREQSEALLQSNNRSVFFSEKENSDTNKGLTKPSFVALESKAAQGKKVLSQQEKTQLGIYLRLYKADNNKYTNKNEKKGFNGPINHLTLGVKDLLLIPEMQQFSPLFETVRGINIDVAFYNPKVRIRQTFLRNKASLCYKAELCKTFSFIKQGFTAQALGARAYSEGVSKNSIYSSIQSKELNRVKDKRKLFENISSESKNSLFKEIKLNPTKKNIKRNCIFNTFYFYLPNETISPKEVGKVFFLTCFQFPSRYN